MKRTYLTVLAATIISAASAFAQNPYMPLWEYIPDGEPYVFEDPDCPGQYRVYVYGSHDDLVDKYCGRDQVVWSAPVDDLTSWRFDGTVFVSKKDANGDDLNPGGEGDILYAPDVAVKVLPDGTKKYYFYPNNQARGRASQIAVGDRPDGPFTVTNWNKENPKLTDGCLGFDPGVFIDDDGRVYGYWGFNNSFGAELDPATMASVKPGTEIVKDMIPNHNQPGVFSFFEASSIRKIEDKYVYIYSRYTNEGEFGLPSSNYTLAYAYGDSPLGPWTYGGTIIDGRGRDVDDNGNAICTANPYGNTHGSIVKIGDQWWVFYHRQTGTDEYSRQAMVAPITVTVEKGKGGKVYISEGEFNSEGFRTEGLNPLDKTAAGIACYLTNPKGIGHEYPHFIFTGSYIQPSRLVPGKDDYLSSQRDPYCPVVNNTAGSVVGYKYFNFDKIDASKQISLVVDLLPQGVDGTVSILVGGPKKSRGGKEIATMNLKASDPQQMTKLTIPVSGLKDVKGKQPLFFVFTSATEDKSLCELHAFQFKEK